MISNSHQTRRNSTLGLSMPAVMLQLYQTEFGEFQTGAQAQLPRRKLRNCVARGAIVKAKALALDLNVPPVLHTCALCEKTYDKKAAICGHMLKHRNRPWKGLMPPPTLLPFDLNEVPKDEDSEIWVDGIYCLLPHPEDAVAPEDLPAFCVCCSYLYSVLVVGLICSMFVPVFVFV